MILELGSRQGGTGSLSTRPSVELPFFKKILNEKVGTFKSLFHEVHKIFHVFLIVFTLWAVGNHN